MFSAGGGLKNTDLLVINEDEAAAFCGTDAADLPVLARACYGKLCEEAPGARLAMTCGAEGSYVCEGAEIRKIPPYPADVVATGGAGDAYTAGIICGLALGMPFLPDAGVSAPDLGAWLAAEAIGVADTIAGHIDTGTLRDYQTHKGERCAYGNTEAVLGDL